MTNLHFVNVYNRSNGAVQDLYRAHTACLACLLLHTSLGANTLTLTSLRSEKQHGKSLRSLRYYFFWTWVESEGVPAPTTPAHVMYITLKISQPTIYTTRNTTELFNQNAPYYLTRYTERYPAALSVLYAVSTTELPVDLQSPVVFGCL